MPHGVGNTLSRAMSSSRSDWSRAVSAACPSRKLRTIATSSSGQHPATPEMLPSHPALQAGVQQPVVADEERPAAAVPRGGKRCEILFPAAAVLDSDDEFFVAQQRERRSPAQGHW